MGPEILIPQQRYFLYSWKKFQFLCVLGSRYNKNDPLPHGFLIWLSFTVSIQSYSVNLPQENNPEPFAGIHTNEKVMF